MSRIRCLACSEIIYQLLQVVFQGDRKGRPYHTRSPCDLMSSIHLSKHDIDAADGSYYVCEEAAFDHQG